MDLLQVILLGLLEGLTEFIPVSSTGHLIILSNFLESHGDKEKVFEVFIQLGAILAVCLIYFDKLFAITKSLFTGSFSLKSPLKGKKLSYDALDILLACIPAMLMGFLFYKYIKEVLSSPFYVACALIVGGLLLIFVEKAKKNESENSDSNENTDEAVDVISRKQAFAVGLFQCLALWPGMSRSGSCIIGGRLAGLSRVMSAEFSFIVAIPMMVAAVSYDMYKNYSLLDASDLAYFMLGFVIAFVSGALAVKSFIAYLAKYSLVPFGVYRILLGFAVLWYFS